MILSRQMFRSDFAEFQFTAQSLEIPIPKMSTLFNDVIDGHEKILVW
jgi:hypothetical protein